MLHKTQENVKWLEFELFAPFPKLKHAIFLRHGGISTGDLASLNFGYTRGDNPLNVTANISKIKNILDIPFLASCKQHHGKEIMEVTSDNPQDTPACDALATSHPGIGLMIKHADCQAAIFYDPVNHAVANVHSGWRGSVQNIYAEAIAFMQSRFGSLPQNIHVGISPSLGPQEAEFVNYRQELPIHFWDYQIKPLYFDFWEISHMQLIESGILDHHIQFAKISTYANPQDYFSHRYCKDTGRHATIAELI